MRYVSGKVNNTSSKKRDISSWLHMPSYRDYGQHTVPRYQRFVRTAFSWRVTATPFQGRLHLTMDWCGQWGREDEAIISWPPHPKLGQLWRAIVISVLAMFYLKPLYLSSPSVQSCFIFFLQWCRPWEHSLINVLHTNLLLRDCFPGKMFCNSDN